MPWPERVCFTDFAVALALFCRAFFCSGEAELCRQGRLAASIGLTIPNILCQVGAKWVKGVLYAG